MLEKTKPFDPVEIGARRDITPMPGIDDMAIRDLSWWKCQDPDPNATTRMDITKQAFNYDPDWDV